MYQKNRIVPSDSTRGFACSFADISAADIAQYLGGRRSGNGFICKCPAHDDQHASLSITDGDRGYPVFKCFAGCEFAGIQAALPEPLRLDRHAVVDHAQVERRRADRRIREKEEAKAAVQEVRQFLETTSAVLPGSDTAAARHLHNRGLDGPYPSSIRQGFVPGKGPACPALVVVARNLVTNEISAVQTTALTDDGRKAEVVPVRKTTGPVKGSVVEIHPTPPGGRIILAEGAEDALAIAATVPDVGVAATLGTSNAAAVDLPLGLDVILCLDGDDPGRRAAVSAAQVLADKGHLVRCAELPEGHDPNSLFMKGEEGRQILRDAIWNARRWPKAEPSGPPTVSDVDDPAGDGADGSIERILDALQRAAGDEPQDDQRPVEQLAGGRLHETVARCERILGDMGDVYQRGSLLARVARRVDPPAGGIQRAQGSPVIVPFTVPAMRLQLTALVRFERFDKRSQEWHPVDCPKDVAETVLASEGCWSSIPPLLGIIEAPTLRPDGSVLEQAGYDRATGLFLDGGSTAFPQVPQQPTKADALAALEMIQDVLAGFPFASDADRAVAFSMILTALVRRSLRSAPMFVATAPKMGSGKSLLATVASYIATGRPPAMMSQADDAESERKRVLAVLMEGDALALIDNVERPLGSDTLCSVLTEPMFRDRLLGKTQTVIVPTCTTWVATGNNVTIVGDLTTRVLVCRIDPQVERPEERAFAVNLHEEVPRRRGELVVAGLTIIRAYHAAGSPKQKLPTFGRFEEWEQLCRFPLTWLGMADPCATRAAAEARDPVRENLSQLAKAWHDAFGDGQMTVAAAEKDAPEELREAMRAVAGDRDGINTRRLGNFVAKHEGRIESGRRFERGEKGNSGIRWRVIRLPSKSDERDESDFHSAPSREVSFSPSNRNSNDTFIEPAEKEPPASRSSQELKYVEGVI